MGLRERVVLLAALAAAVPPALIAWWAATDLEERLIAGRAQELEGTARLLVGRVEGAALSDSLADRLGEASGLRVTLVDPGGAVVGDSRVPTARISTLENHASRPEVSRALAGSVGTATRTSRTVALSQLYVALPHDSGVVRVAAPLERVTAPADRLVRLSLGAAGALVLLLVLASGLQARFVGAPLRSLRRDVEAMAAGERPRPRRQGHDRDEVGRMTRALQGLGDRLERAREREDRGVELTSAFDHLDAGLALLDASGDVRRANRAFGEWVGREDVEGHGLRALFRDPDVEEAVARALEGETVGRELEIGDRTALVSLSPVEDGVLAVFRDLTRLRRLEGVRRDFVANVSHELKTPLTSVLGFAEPLTDPDLPREQVVQFAERILDNGARMRRLIDDLLDLSRIEAGAWEPEPSPIALEAMVESLWRDLAAGGREQRPELAVDVEDAPTVAADPEALRQILRNLIDNALRYGPDGGTVRLASRPEGDLVRVEVIDRGPGIPDPHRDRVFERFYRVDTGRAREAGGTGLGLSIVKHLVAAHGGRIGIESTVGRGTTVWFTLPAP